MKEEECLKHYLYPSTVFADHRGHLVDTILGSCVSVCLYDTKLKFGGINHYMLPLWNGDGLATPKYGNIAIQTLYEKMLQKGSRKENIIAKLFGGANQINSMINVGERNIIIAEEMLAEMNIKLVARHVGGSVGRKIKYNTATGEVLMKLLTR